MLDPLENEVRVPAASEAAQKPRRRKTIPRSSFRPDDGPVAPTAEFFAVMRHNAIASGNSTRRSLDKICAGFPSTLMVALQASG